MSKTKAKKVVKSEEKLKAKEPVEGKQGDPHDPAEVKPPSAPPVWSDWIWDEALKLYYRAKHERGGEWTYDYFDPPIHPATKRVISTSFLSEKIDFPKVEEKVVYATPEYRFEVPNTRGSEYLVSVREEMRGGSGMGGEPGKPAGANSEHAGGKAAVKGESAGRMEGGKEGKAKTGPNLEKSGEDRSDDDPVKQQPQKDGKPRKKDREKHHERKDSRHKERRK